MHAGEPSHSSRRPLVRHKAENGSAMAPASRLPDSLTSFVGRSGDVRNLIALLERADTRIVTLTGPGGVGKTRLALEVAREIETAGVQDVTFVGLVAVSTPSMVAPAIGRAFGLTDVDDESLVPRLVVELSDVSHMLVLDNLEHVIDAAPLVSAMAAACRSLTILTTSRVPLRVSGEREYPVPPLTVVASHTGAGVAEEATAVQLFIERAGINDRSASNAELTAIASICRRLDGLPLAIELAAAKTRILPPEELASRLEFALPLLTDSPRDAPERHRTMRAAIAWSYELLSPGDQSLFRSLSVFNGGFTLESAADVSKMNVSAVIDGITNLADQGLVFQMASEHKPARFTMLETIREFGVEELIGGGNEHEARDRHAVWFASQLDTPLVKELMDANDRRFPLPGEQDNARAALRWSLAQGNIANAATLALGLGLFWWREGFFAEARRSLAEVLAMPGPLPADTRSTFLGLASEYAFQQSEFEEAAALANEALEIAKTLHDTDHMRWNLRKIAWITMVLDPPSAIAPAEEIVELCDAEGDWRASAIAQFMLTTIRAYNDQLPQAFEHARKAQAIIDSHEHIDLGLLATSSQVPGSLALYAGQYAEAEPHLIRALDLRRQQGNRVYEMHCLRDLGRVAFELGDLPEAASRYGEALELAYLLGSEHGKSYCFTEAAAVSRDEDAAATLLGAEHVLRRRLKLRNMPSERILRERTTQRAREALGEARFHAALNAGGSKSTKELYKLARHALSTALSAPNQSDILLTPREREVLILIAQGKSDREIGDALFVSRRTAATHVRNILAKLDVHSRAAAAAWAVRNDIT